MEEFEKNLQDAIKSLKIADHMTYITYQIVNEKRLLLKIFEEIYKTIINCIHSILNYESLYKRIRIYNDKKENLNTFIKISKNYSLTNEQIKKILEIIELYKNKKESSMEFVKKEKVVILSDSLKTKIIDLETIKDYLTLSKDFLMKTKKKFNL